MNGYIAALMIVSASAIAGAADSFKFDFGSGQTAQGYTQVLPDTLYTSERGYGFEPPVKLAAVVRKGGDELRNDFITGDEPFLFSVRLPEGNYRVTLILGDAAGQSQATVKAELRRLMLQDIQTSGAQFAAPVCVVNIRTPRINDAKQVQLKDREKTSEWAAWDDKLTLEFNGRRPCICGIEIEPAGNVPVVYLLGDSTVCDQPLEPWNSWGQMLPRFLKPDVAIANHAESGESLRSSLRAGRFDKIWSVIKPGDYLFIQFGHNDMKSRADAALDTYKADLLSVIAAARAHGATPVLVTSMERKSGIESDTLGRYPDMVREAAAETQTALIDLHSASKRLYKALGPDLDKAFQDGTHHTAFGSFQLAKCIVQGIRDDNLELARYITDDFEGYDPNAPDPFANFKIPTGGSQTMLKPLGS